MTTNDHFRAHLLPGETIVWSGRPAGGIRFSPSDLFAIPFSLVWSGLVLSFVAKGLTKDPPLMTILVFALFFVIGFYIVIGRFLLDLWLRGRTAYALTDKRVLIDRVGPWPEFKALALERLPDVTLSEEAHARGTIRFGAATSTWRNRNGLSPALDPTPQFIGIEEARRVFDMIQARSTPSRPA